MSNSEYHLNQVLVKKEEGYRFRNELPENFSRFYISNDFVHETYDYMCEKYNLTSKEYSIAQKASMSLRYNMIALMGLPEEVQVAMLDAIISRNRFKDDEEIFSLFKKKLTLDEIESVSEKDELSDSSSLDKVEEKLSQANAQIMEKLNAIEKNQERNFKSNLKNLSSVNRNILGIIRFLAMRFSDLYDNGKSKSENPSYPENADNTLKYVKRIDAMAQDEVLRRKTLSRTKKSQQQS
ncbi:hypothetical protein [Ligilactobacillus equi]|nr:hypothetical protein [Ligilactobacillus equi]